VGNGPEAVAASTDGLVNMYRSIRFLETVAANSAALYKWPRPVTLKMESCGRPGTDYDDEAHVVTICYETPFDFAELYRAYVQPPPVAKAAPATADAHVSGRNSGQLPDCGCDVKEGCVSLCSDIYCMNANDETFHFPLSRELGNGRACIWRAGTDRAPS
jgi:Putative metallopeptidase